MIKLKEYLDSFFQLTDKEWNNFSDLFKPVFYKKGTTIYNFPENRKGLCFIIDGMVRSYKITENGKDYTWGFYCLDSNAIENRILFNLCMIDHLSFDKTQLSDLTFEVLLDTTLMCIDEDTLEQLYDSNIRWQKFARAMAEDAFCRTQHRTLSLLTKTAPEKLEEIEEYFPEIFKKNVLLDHIASYIGITRQTLNRIKRTEKYKI